MTHKALIRRLQISCLGLDPIDPLRLLVDDVIEALTQHDSVQAKPEPEQEPVKYSDYESDGVDHNKPPQRTWVGLTDDEKFEICMHSIQNMGANFQETLCKAIETELKQKNGYAEEKNT